MPCASAFPSSALSAVSRSRLSRSIASCWSTRRSARRPRPAKGRRRSRICSPGRPRRRAGVLLMQLDDLAVPQEPVVAFNEQHRPPSREDDVEVGAGEAELGCDREAERLVRDQLGKDLPRGRLRDHRRGVPASGSASVPLASGASGSLFWTPASESLTSSSSTVTPPTARAPQPRRRTTPTRNPHDQAHSDNQPKCCRFRRSRAVTLDERSQRVHRPQQPYLQTVRMDIPRKAATRMNRNNRTAN